MSKARGNFNEFDSMRAHNEERANASSGEELEDLLAKGEASPLVEIVVQHGSLL